MSSKLRTLDYSAARPSRDTWISQGLTPPWVWLYEHSFLNLAGRTFIKCEIENAPNNLATGVKRISLVQRVTYQA